MQELQPADFYADKHKVIFKAIVDLDANGKVDLLTIGDYLRAKGDLDNVGGLTYLTRCVDACIHTDRPDTAISLVKGKSLRRRLIRSLLKSKAYAEDETRPVDEVQAYAEELVLGVRDVPKDETTAESWTDMVEAEAAMKRVGQDVTRRIKSGLSIIDGRVRLRRGRLTTVAADTGIGKSVWATKIIRESALRLNQRVVAWLGEMDKGELYERIFAAELNVSYEAIQDRDLTDAQLERMKGFAKKLDAAPLDVLDKPMTTADIRAYCRFVAHTKGKIDLLVIDYLLLLKELNQEAEGSDRRDIRIGIVVWNLIQLAKELDCHVILVHQFNRQKSSRATGRPRLSDLKESSAIEQHSYNVLLLYRPDRDDSLEPHEREKYKGWLETIIAKARGGKVGNVWLGFKGDTQDITIKYPPWPGDGSPGALPLPGASSTKKGFR